MVRHPFATVRDVVHRTPDPARPRPDDVRRETASDAGEGSEDARDEDLAAMRAAEERLGDEADQADRATRTANAYLAARRRRLRRQLEHTDR